MNNFWRVGVMAGLTALVFCGCDKGPSLAEIEERERASRLYTNAMDDLQAGRLDPAIKGFERVVLQEPKSYSAHFQLATLLQDVRKDYISAIAHYRAYLALRPASDKATVAQDRVKFCESLLEAEFVRKAGGSASNKLVADNEKLTAARDALQEQVKKLEDEVAKLTRDNQRLTTENEARSKTIARLREAVDGSPVNRSAALKRALASLGKEDEEIRRRQLNPTDAELLDDEDEAPKVDLRASAELRNVKRDLAQLDAEPPPPPDPGTAKPGKGGATPRVTTKGASASPLDVLAGKKDKSGAALRPETYTVQEGDTLFKISQRFYGSSKMWRQIQETNRAVVPADGRVRAGQVLKLP